MNGRMWMFYGALAAAGAGAAGAVDLSPEVVKEKPVSSGSYAVSSVVTVGGADAEEPAQFFEKLGSIGVDADGSGNIFVLDNGNAQVQVFDAQGNYLRTVGQEGQGPGEFQLPNRFSVNAGGSVAVFDMGQQRLSIFGPDGQLVRDQVMTDGVGVGDIHLHDDGAITVVHPEGRPALITTYATGGDVAWMYEEAPKDMPRERQVMTLKIGGGALLAAAGDRMVLGSENAYALLPISTSGTAGEIFARVYERQPFEFPQPKDDDEEGGPRMIMIKKEVNTGAGPGGEPGGTKTDISFSDEHDGTIDMKQLKRMMPEFSPDIDAILAWPDGRLWVATSKSDDDTIETDEWSADGEYLRTFVLPAEYDGYRVGADGELYAVSHDEDDFPIVHRLSVSPNF